MKYYRLLEAWKEHDDIEFEFVNSHDKTAAVRDNSTRETLKARLRERLNNSKNLLLIIGGTTKLDRDWIPFEIGYAVDTCKLPIIAGDPNYSSIMAPAQLRSIWPASSETRMNFRQPKVIHVPFKKEPIRAAIMQFDHDHLPNGSLVYYTKETHQKWGLVQ